MNQNDMFMFFTKDLEWPGGSCVMLCGDRGDAVMEDDVIRGVVAVTCGHQSSLDKECLESLAE